MLAYGKTPREVHLAHLRRLVVMVRLIDPASSRGRLFESDALYLVGHGVPKPVPAVQRPRGYSRRIIDAVVKRLLRIG